MSIRRTFASVAGAVLVAALAVAPGPAGASSEYPYHVRGAFTDAYTAQECGIVVDAEIAVRFNVFWNAEQGARATMYSETTMTNPDTGKTVVITTTTHAEGPAPIIDEDAGTATFYSHATGLWQKIQSPNGPVLLVSAGDLGFKQVFDLETWEMLSMERTVESGPHPGADEARYCEAITDALT